MDIAQLHEANREIPRDTLSEDMIVVGEQVAAGGEPRITLGTACLQSR